MSTRDPSVARQGYRARGLLVCGVASPVLYACADLLAGLQWDGYSFRDQTISELGATGAPSQALFSSLLVPIYLLLAIFGMGVWQMARDRRSLRIAGALLIALGVIAITTGPFVAMRPRGADQELFGVLHLLEGGVAMIISLAAMAFSSVALGRRFGLYTVVTVAVMLGFGGWSAVEIPRVGAGVATPWIGVKERIFWYAYQGWFIGLAVALLRYGSGKSAR
jgi:hypothetical membrane protein